MVCPKKFLDIFYYLPQATHIPHFLQKMSKRSVCDLEDPIEQSVSNFWEVLDPKRLKIEIEVDPVFPQGAANGDADAGLVSLLPEDSDTPQAWQPLRKLCEDQGLKISLLHERDLSPFPAAALVCHNQEIDYVIRHRSTVAVGPEHWRHRWDAHVSDTSVSLIGYSKVQLMKSLIELEQYLGRMQEELAQLSQWIDDFKAHRVDEDFMLGELEQKRDDLAQHCATLFIKSMVARRMQDVYGHFDSVIQDCPLFLTIPEYMYCWSQHGYGTGPLLWPKSPKKCRITAVPARVQAIFARVGHRLQMVQSSEEGWMGKLYVVDYRFFLPRWCDVPKTWDALDGVSQ